MKTSVALSVIIASHRPDYVTPLLNALQRQHATVIFETIIVTDYATGTLQSRFPEYSWVYINDLSISKKRNTGVNIARGTIIAFIDDDCIPAPDWIDKGTRYLEQHPGTTAVEGYTAIERRNFLPYAVTREYRRLEKQGYRTNNLFFRKDQFEAIGGFDERFTIQREDIDLAFTALEKGMRYDYSRDIRVTHRYRHGEKWDLVKNCRNRRFDPLLFRKHPRYYLSMLGSPLPPSQLLVLFIHLMTLFTLKNKRSHSAIVAGLNLICCAAFGLRRSGMRPFSPGQWLRETIQMAIAPIVVVGALVYGALFLTKRN
jgi:glycosyltransferase involved in cell wall biosynthesis